MFNLWYSTFKCYEFDLSYIGFYFEGGGCGVGVGLGWGFGTAFGSKYRSSRVIFQGVDFDSKEKGNSTELSKSSPEVRGSR